jgi:hypothetical protein
MMDEGERSLMRIIAHDPELLRLQRRRMSRTGLPFIFMSFQAPSTRIGIEEKISLNYVLLIQPSESCPLLGLLWRLLPSLS